MLHAAVSVAKERRKKEWVEEKCKFAHAKREHWKKNVVWQMLQSKWKDAETSWSLQDQTRHVAEHKSKQLFLLAESSAFVAAFQMIVLYEQSMPGPSDQWFHPAFLAIWGALSTSVACMCMIIMFVSTSLAIFILQKSSNDAMANVCKFTAGFPTSYSDAQLENLTENERKIVFRHNFTSNSTIFDEQARPDGVLTSKAHLESIWNIHCDQLFRHVVIAFSWNIPLFFCSLAMMAVTKFYQWPKTQVVRTPEGCFERGRNFEICNGRFVERFVYLQLFAGESVMLHWFLH